MFRLQAVSEDDTIFVDFNRISSDMYCRPGVGSTGAVFILLHGDFLSILLVVKRYHIGCFDCELSITLQFIYLAYFNRSTRLHFIYSVIVHRVVLFCHNSYFTLATVLKTLYVCSNSSCCIFIRIICKGIIVKQTFISLIIIRKFMSYIFYIKFFCCKIYDSVIDWLCFFF